MWKVSSLFKNLQPAEPTPTLRRPWSVLKSLPQRSPVVYRERPLPWFSREQLAAFHAYLRSPTPAFWMSRVAFLDDLDEVVIIVD